MYEQQGLSEPAPCSPDGLMFTLGGHPSFRQMTRGRVVRPTTFVDRAGCRCFYIIIFTGRVSGYRARGIARCLEERSIW